VRYASPCGVHRGEPADRQPIPAWNFVLIPEDGAFTLIILSDNISSGYINIRSPQFTTVALFGRETLSAPGVTSGRTLTLSHYLNSGKAMHFLTASSCCHRLCARTQHRRHIAPRHVWLLGGMCVHLSF
jgi:hypothetical protein